MSRANRIRIAAAGAAAAVMATAVPAAASAAEEEWDATRYYLMYRSSACIESLTVHEAEDWSAPGDEPYLTVDGWRIWESPGSMDDGATAAVNRTVAVGSVVAAWDYDWPDPDDFIGSDTVGSRGGTLTFQGDGAHYSARYSRGAC
ncbi:hypothetical protein [Glycomyces salinus]|uniref:hypothetical protein n=1 Tax=Glycomyces salinus TaxID=980294 RepID=UPI0018ED90D2|nr:hypothetical protein [Glycomyces salinus]